CHTAQCQYPGLNNGLCGENISCDTAPAHFATRHNIKNLSRDTNVICDWYNCGKSVVRHNFIRHIREAHLGHLR
ncbi:hypothetical protein ID866_9083, partial [Astraeus odoratus]